MGAFALSIMPAVAMARHRRIVRKFQAAGADDVARARDPAELDIRDQHLFGRMVKSGVLVTADGSRYFLSAEGLARWLRRLRIAVLTAVAFVVGGALVAFLLAGQ
jgi:hypothetical protein